MPLDNRERRASVVSLTQSAPPSPTPIAISDQEWRQESGWGYSGIFVGAPAVAPVPTPVVAALRAAGVRISTGLSRRTLEAWRQEVVAFWRNYFSDVGLPEREMITPHIINLDEDDEELIQLL